MLAVLLVVCLSTAAAFAPVQSRARQGALSMNAEFSKSLPFLLKPKNLDGLVVSRAALLLVANLALHQQRPARGLSPSTLTPA